MNVNIPFNTNVFHLEHRCWCPAHVVIIYREYAHVVIIHREYAHVVIIYREYAHVVIIYREYVCLLLLDDLHLGRQTFRGSSTTHGQVFSVLFFKFTRLLLFLRTIELPFLVITYNCRPRYSNNYVQLLTTSCVFYSIVQSYAIQGRGVTTRHYDGKCYVTNSRSHLDIDWQHPPCMYQGSDGYVCDNATYPDLLRSRTNYQVIPSG